MLNSMKCHHKSSIVVSFVLKYAQLHRVAYFSLFLSVGQMSTRVDALEASLQDIINGDMNSTPSVPQSPLPGIKRNGSGLQ